MPATPGRDAPGATPPGYTLESASYSARETELAWRFHFEREAVWEAVAGAAPLHDLTLISAHRAQGLLIVKPPFSLTGMGRRIAFAFVSRDEGTLVRATLLHGMLPMQSRSTRMRQLEEVLHTALRLLENQARAAEEQARQQAAAKEAPPRKTEDAPRPAPAAPAPAAPTAETARIPDAAAAPADPKPRPLLGVPSPQPAQDLRNIPWEELPLEAPKGGEIPRLGRPAPMRAGLGIRRSLLWFLLGTALAVGGVFLLDMFMRQTP